ncbi:hypothetical protein KIK06_14660 [Nocardiopsis sp. EMB25]|uniref:hypothetical protein n=1 Tax=Nocardiopsis TaxID=2013 RepID=UPI000345D6D5|nr:MULTISPECIES: hypothetical protein [Nocardiopsis]MCY9785124.1 hypothetical protein [Nocardiopsis sp. EMB25]
MTRTRPRRGHDGWTHQGGVTMSGPDGDRTVDFFDDLDILPDTTSDERSLGWGEDGPDDDTARLIAERPPHWD